MLGNFSDDDRHDRASYQAVHDAIRALVPGTPRTGNLQWQFAAWDAEHGDARRALTKLAGALSALPHLRATTASERAFRILHGDPRFEALVHGVTGAGATDSFAQQLPATVATLLASADRSERASLMAELLIDINGGAQPLPPELFALAEAHAGATVRDAGLADFSARLWSALAAERRLFAGRAEALAARIVHHAPTPVLPLQLLATAGKEGWSMPATILRRVIARLRPDAEDSTLPIDRRFLPIPIVESGDGMFASFYSSGHLREAGARINGKVKGPLLTLDEQPGSGRFVNQSPSLITSERYAGGVVSGTINSPWHDGDSYQQTMPWALWAGQCLNTIASFVHARPNQS
jgi:hypothetical protein